MKTHRRGCAAGLRKQVQRDGVVRQRHRLVEYDGERIDHRTLGIAVVDDEIGDCRGDGGDDGAVLLAEPSVAMTVYVPGVEPSVARPVPSIELPSLVPVMDQLNVGELMAFPN